MASPYKRRRPSLLRNFWIYRKLVGLAMVLGLMLWFIWANRAEVTVSFPFGFGTFKSTTGLVILLSALVGAATSALGITLFTAVRRIQGSSARGPDDEPQPLPDDRPPADYAAKASEEPSNHHWT
jgi:uncharacterized integral membrane protein